MQRIDGAAAVGNPSDDCHPRRQIVALDPQRRAGTGRDPGRIGGGRAIERLTGRGVGADGHCIGNCPAVARCNIAELQRQAAPVGRSLRPKF